MNTPSTPLGASATSAHVHDSTREAPALTPAQLDYIVHPMTLADLIRDLTAKRWPSPSKLYQHFGFSALQGPTFNHGLMRFLAQNRLLSYHQWLKVWS